MKTRTFDSIPTAAKRIREAVFINEQGFQNEFDATDEVAAHIVIFSEDGVPAGTCRIFQDDDGNYILGRLAVQKQFRGQHLGEELLKAAQEHVALLGGHSISLHSQCRAKDFYKKSEYTEYGDIEYDEGCPHIWMRKSW